MTAIGQDAVQVLEDRADLQRARLLQSILPVPRSLGDTSELPLLSHWCQFHQAVVLADVGRDGHPSVGDFIPDTGLPRRMWAGSRVEFLAQLHDGAALKKVSTVKAVTPKEGRSGKLCFVTVSHEIYADDRLSIREEQDLVYREAAAGKAAAMPAPEEAPQDPHFTDTIRPDPVMLFRYSALTFNSHRIHYDREHAVHVEGHGGLVVHGPLIATLLVDLLGRNTAWRPLRNFTFKALSPLYDIAPFEISGRLQDARATLWAHSEAGGLAVTAQAEFA
ncbi:MaoC family dehydratase N-terminal domain-containing protein [Hoeflea sp.]|uniref:FAS1-like dehydratase domain-containing protein n=1 Tax=Hoeflea sp. TaxID=1940281 RepID=UPI0019BF33E1|nr:MaoC family dehydratase N-terminal domain-containing protein [Hoeflea sp.]MBC7282395.1 acyl-CoA dehydrogenase [Hoeflea sp.]